MVIHPFLQQLKIEFVFCLSQKCPCSGLRSTLAVERLLLMTDCSRAVEDLVLLIRGREQRRKKSNEWVPVFGYASPDASGRHCRNG